MSMVLPLFVCALNLAIAWLDYLPNNSSERIKNPQIDCLQRGPSRRKATGCRRRPAISPQSRVLRRAILYSNRAQQRHKIIRKGVALVGEESVSGVTGG